MSIHSHPLVCKWLKNNQNEDLKVIGWGYRPSGLRAKNSGSPYLLFEDAPVRSILPGYQGAVYGITVDTRGAMFDASGDSDLIDALRKDIKVANQTKQTLQKYREIGASKYNWSLPSDISHYSKGVLLVDQTKGDAALKYGGITPNDFSRMFSDALEEDESLILYIKTHPDHKYRAKKSCFTEEQLNHPRVKLLPADLSPTDCFQFCKTVYVGTSLMGMEALIHGCKVITYGWNFYAGWGLTDDRGRPPLPPRNTTHTLEELFQAAFIDYSHYYLPDSLKPCSLNEILDHIALQKSQWQKFSGQFASYKANSWKRYLMDQYIKGPKTTLQHFFKLPQNPEKFTFFVWGATIPEELKNQKIIHIEDGFLRSNGLGAKLTFPLSWVFDDIGIYFDARSPSRLENILNQTHFTQNNLAQAQELCRFLKKNKLTKYNLGIQEVTLPPEAEGKRVILIPGQVDSDASIKLGSPKIRNNRELLAEVRRQHPDAFICYKPHPDLLSGARADKPLWPGIEQQVDLLIREGDIISWIQAVDEIHTLTSTVGFEALMHEKPVFTYGLPFYAGWGLTTDWLSCERRTASRSLDELVCATLILYPTYLNPKTGEFATALNVAKLLADPNFTFDARPTYIKVVGSLKAFYNKYLKLNSQQV